jgi:hypothetical protein
LVSVTTWEECRSRREREALRYLLESGAAYEQSFSVAATERTLFSLYTGRTSGAFYSLGI